jgi:hypothetical protein
MKKLYELLNLKETQGTFGIEIECEGANLRAVENETWTSTDDGSLRGHFPESRIEWVLKKPLPLGKAITAVSNLNKMQERHGAVPKFSYRTSVHVHTNVQQFTEDQYLNFLYTYLLIEDPLIKFCGKQREANRFCLSINNGEGLMDYLAHVFRNGYQAIARLDENAVRYAAMNIAATRKYGSLEFRSMRGTLDTEVLTTWLIALDNIRSFAEKQENVRDIHDKFVKSDPLNFFREVVGDVSEAFEYKGMEGDIRNNFSITLELVYAYQPFSEKRGEKPILKKDKHLEELFVIAAADPDWQAIPLPDNVVFERLPAENPWPQRARRVVIQGN